jgi:TonB-linked SusC/RagA family outer membrane protein
MKKTPIAAVYLREIYCSKILKIMRNTLLLLLINVFHIFATDTYSQSTKLTMSLEDVTVKDVLAHIEEKSEFYFLYNSKLVDVNRKTNIKAENQKIDKILDLLFRDTNVNYMVFNRQIILSPKEYINSLQEEAKQPTPIIGTVTDENGDPLVGVTVTVKGSTKGTITDLEGKYSLTDIPDDATLVFSFVGMLTQEVPVAGSTNISITMAPDLLGLEEVVVVGYGTQKKANLTGAVAGVDMNKVLGNRPVSDMSTLLKGTIPGLTVSTTTGQPGESPSINIRGITSINGGSPLILVDNVPMDIDNLNPADIESVSVLKDASSSAIYGGRAAFGVILITTKKALKNEPIKFNYSNSLSINQPTELPQQVSILENIQMLRDFGNTINWQGRDLDTWESLVNAYHDNPDLYPEGSTIEDGVFYTVKESNPLRFLDNSFSHIHNFSFSGGSERSSYRASFGYANEDGIMITEKDRYKKYNFNAFLSTALTEKLTSSLNILYLNDKQLNPSYYNDLFKWARIHSTAEPTVGSYTDPETGESTLWESPYNVLNNEPADQLFGNELRIFGQLDYEVIQGLNIIGEYTFQKTNNRNINLLSDNVYANAREYGSLVPLNSFSSYSRTSFVRDYHAINLYTQFEKTLNNHNFQAVVGANWELSENSMFNATRLDLLSVGTPSLATASGTMSNDESFSEYSIAGYFARINYRYKDKYLVEFNGRYDGSSKFPQGDHFGFFPSVSAGWIMSQEAFMQPLKPVLSSFKLRGSYGDIGNQSIANYKFIPVMSPYNANWIDPSTNIRYLTLASPDLISSSFTWETVRTMNVGFDLGLFNQKVNATFNYFKRMTLGMLGAGAELPAVLGAPAPEQNVADLESKGWLCALPWHCWHE